MTSWISTFMLAICIFLVPQGSYGAKPKVMFINSYHAEYEWSSGIIKGVFDKLGITQNLNGKINDQLSSVDLEVFHMDTKRNTTEAFKKEAALRAQKRIEEWGADVVIVADDNAFKYLVVPYYQNADLPIVFCGVNWDVTHYENAPYKNTTGMLEVALVKPLIKHLRDYTNGDRVGFLSGNRYSDRAEAEYSSRLLDIQFTKEYYVNSFEQWKSAFRNLQHEVDFFIWTAVGGIEDWDGEKAKKLILEEADIPYGTVNSWMMPFELIGVTKNPMEQGEWAANAALDILGGTSPKDIPIVTNKKAQIHLNMQVAKRLGVKFPIDLIEDSHLISAEPLKLFFVNSYHKGFQWSDDIEKGLLKALKIKSRSDDSYDTSQSLVDLKIFRMDTKRNKSIEYIKETARQAREIIETWEPDIVVASDDNASKYLIMPYYKESRIPFVFCGLNWDASVYGFPTPNITGMIEVGPLRETVKMLTPYAKGPQIGIIGAYDLSNQKEIKHTQTIFSLQKKNVKLVKDFEEWKKEYLALQQTVDMIIFLHPIGITGWDRDQAEEFIMKNTTIPTGAASDDYINLALLGNVKIAEEQGWWAGQTALKILGGTAPREIPVTENKQTKLYLNMKLAKQMGIRFPMELIQQASFLGEDTNL